MTDFYNTTNETGERLKSFEIIAVTQEDIVLHVFQRRPAGTLLAPSQVWTAGFPITTPLTSVRRAMTNMTIKGLLTKTDTKIKGLYGREAHTWKLQEVRHEKA